jgi:phage repressor protein C with HTH and peptisase S24 domain
MQTSMLTHAQIWSGLDRLAARAKLSPSGLAKRAGLDPTTFNKSKRITPDGRARWPSTESLAKALSATNVSIDSFVSLISEESGARNTLPMISIAQASNGGYFDEHGYPTGSGWQEIAFPAVHDEHAYALEIVGDGMQPAYRDGDVVIVSPAAPVRQGDRLVLKSRNGELMVKELTRQTPKSLELKAVNDGGPDRELPLEDVAWMARVVWARQ